MRQRCNIADQGCAGQCSTECFKCGLPACSECSTKVDYLRYGVKRICRQCRDEIKEDEKRYAEDLAKRKEKKRQADKYLAAHPNAPGQFVELVRVETVALREWRGKKRSAEAAYTRFLNAATARAKLEEVLPEEISKAQAGARMSLLTVRASRIER